MGRLVTLRRSSYDAAMPKRKVRFAVAGLGAFAHKAILPAFAAGPKGATLAALVSSDARKLKKLAKSHAVERTASFEDFDALCASGDIDAVYLAVPNHKHREYTERAARHGVHVLVEKPMAPTEQDCEAMIEACRAGGARLMIAYRPHFEESQLRAVDVVRRRKLGTPRFFLGNFSFQVAAGNVRLNPPGEGGGALFDIGVYCVNAARTLFGEEPLEIFAAAGSSGDSRWGTVDEQYSVILRFPDGKLASFTVGFGAALTTAFEIVGDKGALRVDPAFNYVGARHQRLTVGGKVKHKKLKHKDQIVPQISYFADCVLAGRDPEPGGAEGLADVRIVRAAYRSIADGRPVRLAPSPRAAPPAESTPRRRPDLAP
jgi:glucose-fructose oxidoreductase